MVTLAMVHCVGQSIPHQVYVSTLSIEAHLFSDSGSNLIGEVSSQPHGLQMPVVPVRTPKLLHGSGGVIFISNKTIKLLAHCSWLISALVNSFVVARPPTSLQEMMRWWLQNVVHGITGRWKLYLVRILPREYTSLMAFSTRSACSLNPTCRKSMTPDRSIP